MDPTLETPAPNPPGAATQADGTLMAPSGPVPGAPSPVASGIRRYRAYMIAFGILHLATGGAFLFYPQALFAVANLGPQISPKLQAMPAQAEFFWLPLAAALMVVLAATSFLAAESPKVRGYPLILLFAKIASASAYAHVFLHRDPAFPYAAAAALETLLALAVSWFWIRLPSQKTTLP